VREEREVGRGRQVRGEEKEMGRRKHDPKENSECFLWQSFHYSTNNTVKLATFSGIPCVSIRSLCNGTL
jgi:hypothetical protein